MIRKNKIKCKSVGDVKIFEISGKFEGHFASTGQSAMQKNGRSVRRKNVFFNLGNLDEIDEKGVEGLVSSAQGYQKCALLTDDKGIMESVRQRDTNDCVSVLENEKDVTDYFAKEFARQIMEVGPHEKRRYIRLKAVMPVEFECELEDGNREKFFAVVTNLSEGGLFAEFIRSEEEEKASHILNPYDLKLLGLKLALKGEGIVQGRGKMIHGSIADGGIGIEFYELKDEGRSKVRNWVEKNLEGS
jgi:hypothetical protein